MHRPRSNSVTLGGVPLLDLPLERLRTKVSLVMQEHRVFMGTVADMRPWTRSTPTSGCSPFPRGSRQPSGQAVWR